MAKPILYPLFAKQDEKNVRPILEALQEKGFSLAPPQACGERDTVLFFLSRNLTEDSPLIDTFLRLDAGKRDLIPVNLDGTAPPALIEHAIMARNTVFAERYTVEELAGRIAEAVKEPAGLSPKVRKMLIAAAIVVLLAVIGIVLWRVFGRKEIPAESSGETEETTAAARIPGNIPPEDVEKIVELAFVGDRYYWYTRDEEAYQDPAYQKGADEVAYSYQDESGTHWISKENGQEIPAAGYEDLDWLTALPNLQYLTMVRTEGTLPNLAGLARLKAVNLSDTALTDLSFLRGAALETLDYTGDNVSRFETLNDCPNLRVIHLDLARTASVDFSAFAPPAAQELFLSDGSGISPVDLSGLKGKFPRLTRLRLMHLTPADLSFLEGMEELEILELRFLDLERLDGVENLKKLRILALQDVNNLADISAIAGCTELEQFLLTGYPQNVTVSDLSALGKLPHLSLVSNVAALNTDLDFLKELPTKEHITFYLVNQAVTDYSGFAAIKSYDYIYMNMDTREGKMADPGPALAYLQEASIDGLYLRNAVNTDLSLVSHVATELGLETCDIRDFTTLGDNASFRYLSVDDCGSLQSLDGLEKNRSFGRTREARAGGGLYLENCPHLTDWSALNGLYLEECGLIGLNTLPDFSTFRADTYYLEGIAGMTDLRCLEGLDPAGSYSFDLSGLEGLTDISTLYQLKGRHLCLRPEWKEQAEELVSLGRFESYEVRYPAAPWQPNEGTFTLLSLDELDTLPPSVLARVEELCVAGDVVVDSREYRIEEDWSTDPPAMYLCRNDAGEEERILIQAGTRLTDLSVLQKLTGLQRLQLYQQPLVTLEGIQYLESLQELTVENCEKLTDISAAFTLQALTCLNLCENDHITSVQGIQNLYQLETLTLAERKLSDLTPVLALPKLRLLTISSDMKEAVQSLPENPSFIVAIRN